MNKFLAFFYFFVGVVILCAGILQSLAMNYGWETRIYSIVGGLFPICSTALACLLFSWSWEMVESNYYEEEEEPV